MLKLPEVLHRGTISAHLWVPRSLPGSAQGQGLGLAGGCALLAPQLLPWAHQSSLQMWGGIQEGKHPNLPLSPGRASLRGPCRESHLSHRAPNSTPNFPVFVVLVSSAQAWSKARICVSSLKQPPREILTDKHPKVNLATRVTSQLKINEQK